MKKQLEETKNLLAKANSAAETEKTLRENLEKTNQEKENKEKLQKRIATIKKHFNPSDELLKDIEVKIKDLKDDEFEKTVSFYLSLLDSKIAAKEELKEEKEIEAKVKELDEKELDKMIDELVKPKVEKVEAKKEEPKKFESVSLEKLLLMEEK